jgi:hypothetical protein
MKLSRNEANRKSKALNVRYEVAQFGEDFAPRSKRLSRSIVAQSAYRLQSLDEQRIAEYAIYWIVVGEDFQYVQVQNVQVC